MTDLLNQYKDLIKAVDPDCKLCVVYDNYSIEVDTHCIISVNVEEEYVKTWIGIRLAKPIENPQDVRGLSIRNKRFKDIISIHESIVRSTHSDDSYEYIFLARK